MEDNSTKKFIRNISFFLALILLTLWVILKDQSITEIINVFNDVKWQYVFIGILSMTIYVFLEGYNIRRTLKMLKQEISIKQAFKYSLIGYFFSAITPAASGGQPMQIYYMHKDKISVSNSTLALLVNLASTQISTISIALISILFNYKFMNRVLIILLVIGVSLNLSALAMLLIGLFSKRLSRWLIMVAMKFLKIFRVKKIKEKKYKLVVELKNYQKSAKYIKAHKKLVAKILITTFIQFIVFYNVAYWTYRSLGFGEKNILEITTMQSVLFASVSGIPSPGAVGVSEGAFIEIYRNIYPTNMIKSATLLHRGINFYFYVIISGIVVVINEIRIKRRIRLKKGKIDD